MGRGLTPGFVAPIIDPATLEWMRHSACNETMEHLFFPDTTGATATLAHRAAKTVCAACPVTRPCLEYALQFGPQHDGVWGGTTRRERQAILRATKAAA